MIHYNMVHILGNALIDRVLYSYTEPDKDRIVVHKRIDAVEYQGSGFLKLTVVDSTEKTVTVLDISPDAELETYPMYHLSQKMDTKPYIGDLIPVDQFAEMVNTGCFIDSDGDGSPYNAEQKANFHGYYTVQQLAAMYTNPEVTHINWCNK